MTRGVISDNIRLTLYCKNLINCLVFTFKYNTTITNIYRERDGYSVIYIERERLRKCEKTNNKLLFQ